MTSPTPQSSVRAYPPRRRLRWGTLTLIVLGHLIVLAGLVRALAPDFTAAAIEQAGSLVTVTITAPPEPTPTAEPELEPEQGAAAPAAADATPREVTAPKVPLPRPSPAPPPPRARKTTT